MNERPTARVHRELAALLREGDLAIDATAGNGHDTLFLAQQVGAGGRVLAYDIQAAAIAATRERIAAAGLAGRVELHQASHATMARHAPAGGVAAIVFNLGYLPGGDHAVITRTGETLAALAVAAALLRPGGLLAVTCYPGHPGGDAESEAVLRWAESCGGLEIAVFRREGTLRPAPFLVQGRKKMMND